MVVKSLKLGKYKNLQIETFPDEIDREIIVSKMKEMMVEKLNSNGIRNELEETVLLLDDTAAKSLDIEGVSTLSELEDYIRRSLFRDKVINNVIRKVLDDVTIEYNHDEVERELEEMILSIEDQAINEGFTLEFYCDYNGIKDTDELRRMCRQEIYTAYLEICTLEEIAKKEQIVIDQCVLKSLIERYERLDDEYTPDHEDDLRKSLVIKATVDWLVQNNTQMM